MYTPKQISDAQRARATQNRAVQAARAAGSPANQTPQANQGPPMKRQRPDFIEDFTVYELDFLALAPAATSTQAIAIQADSAFAWTKAAYYATIANAAFVENTRPIPSVTVQILDTGSGRQLFNAALPVPSIFGVGQLPFILPVERVFQRRSSMSVTVNNFDAAVTYNLRLSFIGKKIFYYGED